MPQELGRYIIRKAFCCHSFFFNSITIIIIIGICERVVGKYRWDTQVRSRLRIDCCYELGRMDIQACIKGELHAFDDWGIGIICN